MHETGNADLDRGGGMEAELALDRADIRIGGRHVARLDRMIFANCGAPARSFEQVDHAAELFGTMVADIVEPMRADAAAGLGLAIVEGGDYRVPR